MTLLDKPWNSMPVKINDFTVATVFILIKQSDIQT